MTAPPDPAAVAAAERDHAARLLEEHRASCHPMDLSYPGDGRGPDIDRACPECGSEGPHPYWPAARVAECADCCEEFDVDTGDDGRCATCTSLAGHAERTARQAELLAPAETGEMF